MPSHTCTRGGRWLEAGVLLIAFIVGDGVKYLLADSGLTPVVKEIVSAACVLAFFMVIVLALSRYRVKDDIT